MSRFGWWSGLTIVLGSAVLLYGSLTPTSSGLANSHVGSAASKDVSSPSATSSPTTSLATTTTTLDHHTQNQSSPSVSATTTTTSPLPLPAQLASTGGAQQLLIVDAPSWGATTATLTAWTLTQSGWVEALGPISAHTGYSGWETPSNRHEGDGSTPVGLFSIGSTIYGVNPNPGGMALTYHQLIPGDYWDENPASPTYNTFQESTNTDCANNPFGGDTECLWQETVAYQYFAVIEFNPAPTSNPIGSGVFLHVSTESATAGCVSLNESDLLSVLRWLNPSAHPMIAEAPDDTLRSL